MKTASAATLAILASGQYFKVECYAFALAGGVTQYYTAGDAAITVGGITYQTGLTITRSSLSQKTGLEVPTVDLTITPQLDNPTVPVGYLSALRAGVLDGSRITISKGFFNLPAAGQQLDTSPGLVPWFQGHPNEIEVGRFTAQITVNADLELLNVQMPPNLLQSGCVHTVYDTGCTLSKAAYTTAGSISGSITANSFHSALTQADHYYDLGVLIFTSGVLAGQSYTIATYLNSGGSIQTVIPFASAPSTGDAYTARPACDKTKPTCTTRFSNQIHWRGYRNLPQPESLYDGGTPGGSARALGGQGGQGAGSNFSGGLGKNTYVR